MDSFSPEVLLALQALLSKELASRGVSSAAAPAKVAKAPKVSKEAKEATGEAKAKRAPGAWAAWTKHAPLAHAEEYAAFKASAVVKQGIAPLFCTQWRKDHAEEYAAFELAHKASPSAEPSVASPASAPSPASVASPAAPSPAKEKRKWSEEAKANAAAKRAAKKAGASVSFAVAESVAIIAAAPAPLPAAPPKAPVPAANPFDEEDAEVELLPFKIGGRTYLRPGSSVAGSAPIWATGDLWESNKGLRGDWAGALQEDGSIDMDAEEPDFE
jgi:hypothetical protein